MKPFHCSRQQYVIGVTSSNNNRFIHAEDNFIKMGYVPLWQTESHYINTLARISFSQDQLLARISFQPGSAFSQDQLFTVVSREHQQDQVSGRASWVQVQVVDPAGEGPWMSSAMGLHTHGGCAPGAQTSLITQVYNYKNHQLQSKINNQIKIVLTHLILVKQGKLYYVE